MDNYEKDLMVNNLKLATKGQEELRIRIVRTCKKHLNEKGNPISRMVADICECSESHVRSTWGKYKKGGVAAIKAKKMGRKTDTGKLNKEMQQEIRKLIVDKCPDQLKLPGFLWDRQNVADLIYQKYKITLALTKISDYLKKWGMTPQRPVKKSYKQDPAKIEKWLNEEYPEIKEKAKEQNAEIHWLDETGMQNQTNYIKGYAPIGKTPTMPVNPTKIKINMVSTITNKGKMRFMFYKQNMNAKVLIDFFWRLIKRADKKLFVILDNLPVHHAKLVKEWIKKHQDKIEIFFLPPHAPEYNPDELLNNTLKRSLAKKGFSKDENELEKKARSTMKTLQNDHAKMASFFQSKNTEYAQ
jgi:transposase